MALYESPGGATGGDRLNSAELQDIIDLPLIPIRDRGEQICDLYLRQETLFEWQYKRQRVAFSCETVFLTKKDTDKKKQKNGDARKMKVQTKQVMWKMMLCKQFCCKLYPNNIFFFVNYGYL